MVLITDTVHRIIAIDKDAVGALEETCAPMCNQFPVRGENADRLFAAAKGINVIPGVYGNPADFPDIPFLRKLAPMVDRFILKVSAA
jgi:hypothetical protein